MSASNELAQLFPSALHPAIPIATQLLSTLRNLTAPGRGNDLRPEERAALVGVAALIGCEKVQSKDLVEKSAQKASSVSPAHFRSALAHSRRILATVDSPSLDASPSRTRSGRSSPSSRPSEAPAPDAATQPSPFSTPKKRFKYSSGIDISDLVKGSPKHTPAASSPLRHSVTPSSRLRSGGEDDEQMGAAEDEHEEDVRTPTKRTRFGVKQGVDLEHVAVPPVLASGKRKREDVSSFLALRPGSGIESPVRPVKGVMAVEDGLPDITPRSPARVRREGRKKPKKPRRDWTYSEVVWGSRQAKDEGSAQLKKLLEEFGAWQKAQGGDLASGDEDVVMDELASAGTSSDAGQ